MTLYFSFDEMPIFNFLMIYKTNNYYWIYKEYYTEDNDFNYNQNINKDFLIFGFLKIAGEFQNNSSIYEDMPKKEFNYISGGIEKKNCNWSFITTVFSGHIYHLRTKKGNELFEYLNEIKLIGELIVENFLNENSMLENQLNIEINFEKTTLSQWCELRKKTFF